MKRWHDLSIQGVLLPALALLVAALSGLVACTPVAESDVLSSPEAMAASVTIHRDAYGVPHVYGPTDASVAFGYLYAQAEDNFWQIEDSYIQALGRAAEVHGEAALAQDLLNRALEIPRLAREEFTNSDPRLQEVARGGMDGLNYYLATHPEVKPRLLERFEPWHVFALSRFAIYQLFIFGRTGVGNGEILGAVKEIGGGDELARLMPGQAPRLDAPATTFAAPVPAMGSNMWAVSPHKSESGHALLLINPHQPFFGPGQWYEGHVRSDEGLHMTGASFFGSPLPTLGHNEHLGWSHTVNRPDIADLYIEHFDDPENPRAYRYGDGYREADTWRETLQVKGAQSREFELTKTHHGPVVARRDGEVLTVRMAKLVEGGQTATWYAMARARSLDEFKAAMATLSIPMFNTLYADKTGNIFYVYNAAVPRRSTDYDWSQAVDGSDPATEWQGYHTFDELPQIENPPSGFLQNCNATPFLATDEGNPKAEDFPPYMAPEPDNPRSQISRRILAGEEKFSFEEWARYGFDTKVLLAETQIPGLVEEWRKLEATDPGRARPLAKAVETLEAWDGVSTVDSVAMTLFARWMEVVSRGRGEAGAAFPRVTALEAVVAALTKDHDSWEVPWGEVNRLQRRHTSGTQGFDDEAPSLPVAGAPGPLGIVFNFYTRPQPGLKRRYGVAGHSFVSVVEFGDPVEARSVLVFGQSGHEDSPHYFDQAELYASRQFKDAWFQLSEVEESSQRAYHPGE